MAENDYTLIMRRLGRPLLLGALCLLAACSQPLSVSINDQAVFDPAGRLPGREALDPDLQGCINLAVRQQQLQSAAQLNVLSCSSSNIMGLDNIGQLVQLRFLDLSNNNISNLFPLEQLRSLSGLILSNNAIIDISPLFNMPSLTSVSLEGNPGIPCSQLNQLRRRLGEHLLAPQSCRN